MSTCLQIVTIKISNTDEFVSEDQSTDNLTDITASIETSAVNTDSEEIQQQSNNGTKDFALGLAFGAATVMAAPYIEKRLMQHKRKQVRQYPPLIKNSNEKV